MVFITHLGDWRVRMQVWRWETRAVLVHLSHWSEFPGIPRRILGRSFWIFGLKATELFSPERGEMLLDVCVCVCKVSAVVSDSLWPHGLQPIRLLCPWNSPNKNTGVDGCALLQGIFLAQGLTPRLLHHLDWHAGSLPLAPPGKPYWMYILPQSLWLKISKQSPPDFPGAK